MKITPTLETFSLKTGLLIFSLFLFTQCTKKEYIEIDVAPQLRIVVKDQNNKAVDGATVRLYLSEENFYSGENVVQEKVTGSNGEALFQKLSETIYFFYAAKGDLDNYYEVVTFSEPLRENELKTITCLIR